jgi:hypothetical protein
MSVNLGPINIACDSPSYDIVLACEQLKFYRPLDIRWCSYKPIQTKCFCGQIMPILERFTFTFQTGTVEEYSIGQCKLCNTIYWKREI